MRCKELYLDIYKKDDFEELKDDLYDDYVVKQLFINNSENSLFQVLDSFYNELVEK